MEELKKLLNYLTTFKGSHKLLDALTHELKLTQDCVYKVDEKKLKELRLDYESKNFESLPSNLVKLYDFLTAKKYKFNYGTALLITIKIFDTYLSLEGLEEKLEFVLELRELITHYSNDKYNNDIHTEIVLVLENFYQFNKMKNFITYML